MPDEKTELCHLVSRLADVLESVVRETSGDKLTLTKLDNIRHDVLKLLIKRPR